METNETETVEEEHDFISDSAENFLGETEQQKPVEVAKSEPPKSEPEPPKSEPPKSDPIDSEKVAELAALKLEERQRKAAEQNKQLSPEEIKKLFKPFIVTNDVLRKLGYEESTPEQVAAYQEFVNGVVQQAFHMAKFYADKQLEELRAQAEPLMEYYQSSQSERYVQQFYSKHADLKPYQKIVQGVAAQVSPTHPDGRPKSYEEVELEISTNTRELLQSLGLNLADGQQQATHGAATNRVPRMAALQGSGRSLSGGSSGGKTNNPDRDIYD